MDSGDWGSSRRSWAILVASCALFHEVGGASGRALFVAPWASVPWQKPPPCPGGRSQQASANLLRLGIHLCPECRDPMVIGRKNILRMRGQEDSNDGSFEGTGSIEGGGGGRGLGGAPLRHGDFGIKLGDEEATRTTVTGWEDEAEDTLERGEHRKEGGRSAARQGGGRGSKGTASPQGRGRVSSMRSSGRSMSRMRERGDGRKFAGDAMDELLSLPKREECPCFPPSLPSLHPSLPPPLFPSSLSSLALFYAPSLISPLSVHFSLFPCSSSLFFLPALGVEPHDARESSLQISTSHSSSSSISSACH